MQEIIFVHRMAVAFVYYMKAWESIWEADGSFLVKLPPFLWVHEFVKLWLKTKQFLHIS